MKRILCSFFLLAGLRSGSQELYVFSDPASNVPANSITAKLSASFFTNPGPIKDRLMQRYSPDAMFGLSKNLMLRGGLTFADMHTPAFRWESVYLYSKYRFLSNDDVHKHFRMAAFFEAGYSRSPFHYDEINIQGDKSGLQAGLIATQLWNKLAVSGTVSHTQVLHASRRSGSTLPYSAMNYSLSAGYLMFPREYTDYRQTNINLYAEFLAQQTMNPSKYYADLAPAIQFIFNSNAKLNLGYRVQLGSNMLRMTNTSWLISFERTFL